jgi:hypothetical protein
MPRYYTVLLVVARSIASQFEDFSSQVFEDGCEVYGRTCTTALHRQRTHSMWVEKVLHSLRVVAFLQQTVDTTNGELETGFGRA